MRGTRTLQSRSDGALPENRRLGKTKIKALSEPTKIDHDLILGLYYSNRWLAC